MKGRGVCLQAPCEVGVLKHGFFMSMRTGSTCDRVCETSWLHSVGAGRLGALLYYLCRAAVACRSAFLSVEDLSALKTKNVCTCTICGAPRMFRSLVVLQLDLQGLVRNVHA